MELKSLVVEDLSKCYWIPKPKPAADPASSRLDRLRAFFSVTPPAVHGMVVKLERERPASAATRP